MSVVAFTAEHDDGEHDGGEHGDGEHRHGEHDAATGHRLRSRDWWQGVAAVACTMMRTAVARTAAVRTDGQPTRGAGTTAAPKGWDRWRWGWR